MSKPAEASEAVPSHVQDPSLAWEERRKTWLEPNSKGKRRATQAATTRLEKVLVPKSKAEEASADRSTLEWLSSSTLLVHSSDVFFATVILGIKARLADKDGLKEPMQLRIMVSELAVLLEYISSNRFTATSRFLFSTEAGFWMALSRKICSRKAEQEQTTKGKRRSELHS
jgi:hypothetical protein